MKCAIVDLGSNTIRLSLYNTLENGGFETLFSKKYMAGLAGYVSHGIMSNDGINQACAVLLDFKILLQQLGVKDMHVFATASLRNIKNTEKALETIKRRTGLSVDVIEGSEEGILGYYGALYTTDLKNGIMFDIGGGSTEFSLFYEGKIIASKSFKNGTVRLLNNMVNEVVWQEIEKWIKTNTEPFEDITLIGSGGNINKLFKLSEKQQDKPLSYVYVSSQYQKLNSMTYEQRIAEIGLNPDRADVIIPATRIYLNAMKWSGARHIYVPKIGLSDGIVKAMYYGRI